MLLFPVQGCDGPDGQHGPRFTINTELSRHRLCLRLQRVDDGEHVFDMALGTLPVCVDESVSEVSGGIEAFIGKFCEAGA